jgi:LacI family transcriptional regulator
MHLPDLKPSTDTHDKHETTFRAASKNDVTIADVAREAGVSIRAVSRVLNGGNLVSAKKRLLIQNAINKFGFVPSATARGLPGARNYTIGLIFGTLSATYMVDIQLAAVEICHRHGYRLIVEQFTSEMLASPAAAKEAIANLRIDGAIVLPPACDNMVLLDALDTSHVAFTRLAPTIALERSAAVTMDDESATRAMVQHLTDLGHTQIGFVVGHSGHPSAHRRLEAFWAAVKDLKLNPENLSVGQGDYSFESGIAAAKTMLDAAKPPTAIFASNDAMAAGVIAAAGMRGLVTPRDLSVCGFDDSALSRYIWPTLTTIRQPLSEMARAAAEQLLAPQQRPRSILFDFTLLVRASTTPPQSQSK